eukprot:CAMPEP_0119302610 /NCGR_PEP_ID=MMETSP1333-20130426/4181_1 /TAXON_ID=418940 /ORGANISM="Scyphosphaera apsteinii, Strain RCC1455" /LENGTH=262 /DNA_ID=CAMNT_0007305015 /DNA_START=22 /DNA_END=807 /DNA_ORIENTATION=+
MNQHGAARLQRQIFPVRRLVTSRVASHRPFARRDAERLRFVCGGGFARAADNPGVRLEPNFIGEQQAGLLIAEARETSRAFGYEYDGDRRAHTLGANGKVTSTADLVNNIRVTGRPEKSGQLIPPWGYGNSFEEGALPPGILTLVHRIRGCGLYMLGPLRDVTINQRTHSFFQLDPHVDPIDDGPDVFVLNLLSSVVITFSPTSTILEARGQTRRRESTEVGLRSWSDLDIDALVQPNTLLHFCGDARLTWNHAIRAGVQVD